MKITDNLSFDKNPITNILGVILTIVGTALYVIPYFYEPKSEPNVWVPAGIAAVGLLLLLSPDSLVYIIKKKSE
jgi:RsiW-degrading membrane proteinase PrsW (M82 family)